MAHGKGQIGLTIAERAKPTPASFNYRASTVENWVQDLPMGNIGAMSKLLYDSLREVNRLAISWRERHRFLELFREPIEYVQEQLLSRYKGLAFPLPTKAQHIVDLSKALSNEMALGYKTAIEEMLASNFLNRDNKSLTELIHRAIFYTSCSLLTSYRTYAPASEDSWFELHLLFLHAEQKKIHTQTVVDKVNEKLPDSSIARLYKQILLLALASPYRMRQGEAWSVYHALARWAGHAQIIPYNDPSASEALFVVHLDSDEAPDFLAYNHRDCNTELCRLVDTRQLSHLLHEELSYLNNEGKTTEEGITAELFLRLVRSWSVAPKRSFHRLENDSNIEVVIGLTNIHRRLAAELGDSSLFSPEKSHFQGKSVSGVSQPTSKDIWNIFSKDKLGKQYEQYEQHKKESESEPEQEESSQLKGQLWQIRNESAGGYRLAVGHHEGSKLQVGELLGLRRHLSDETCEAGIIRWMRQPADGGFEVGVQVLAPQVVPIMLRNTRLGSKASEFQPSLLLPEVPTIGLPATILTPVMLFETGTELQLHHPEHDIRIKLVERGQHTGSFTQYRFDTLAEMEQYRPAIKVPSEGAEVKDDLSIDWEDL